MMISRIRMRNVLLIRVASQNFSLHHGFGLLRSIELYKRDEGVEGGGH